jgi:hypothetical protein
MVVNATTPALRITQTGTGDSILVEDAANPDSTPFVVTAAGDVGIGTSSPSRFVDIEKNQNASTILRVGNTTSGTAAYSALQLESSTITYLYNFSNGYTTSGKFEAGVTLLDANGIAGLTLCATASAPIKFLTNGSETMRLDAAGNLGLGVTPSAWGPSYRKAIQLNAGASIAGGNGATYVSVGANNYIDETLSYKYIQTAVASRYEQVSGAHQWFTAPSGFGYGTAATSLTSTQNGNSYTIVTAGTTDFTLIGAANNNVGTTFTKSGGTGAGDGTVSQNISFTQAMTLDASGNLGVGTTSPSTFNQNQLYGAVIGNGTSLPGLTLYGGTTSGGSLNFADGTSGTDQYRGSVEYNHSSDFMAFRTASTERVRITSGGILGVNAQGATYSTEKLAVIAASNSLAAAFKTNAGATEYTVAVSNTATSGDNKFIVFATESTDTIRGSITYDRAGGLVAYNTTSDYRAKDIFGPVTNSGETIDALKVYNGKMKGATLDRPMLVAHEAQEVTPYAVTGDKDAVNENGDPVFQQMNLSAFVPLLIAEIQSLRARVAQLEQGA